MNDFAREDVATSEQAGQTPAAEYVRMSTEHQQYSTANQRDVIRDYARRKGFTIVRTYADEGKSGLRIAGREGLQRLIQDVQSTQVPFRTILVYDISRWGRFQDSDESAYYEHLCKRAGIHVAYCAEQFENDGSPTATIIKSVKRAMAGEYSRDLSTKVHKGQCRLIQLGFRQGGTAGYGLRRMLLDQAGTPKGLLKPGEHKCLQTDRVVLVPGPEEEVAVVRLIYELFIKQSRTESHIARMLQERAVPSESGRPWTKGMVHQILTNEKYIGNNVYNRVSFKLKMRRVRNPSEQWVRADHAFEPIVDPQLFYVARGIIQERSRTFTTDEMVDKLRQLFAAHSRLSAFLIDDADGVPSSATYRHRFGSLVDAYRIAGYRPERDYQFLQVNRRLQCLYPTLVGDAAARLREVGADVITDAHTDHLVINGEYRAAMVLTRCRQTTSGRLKWSFSLDGATPPDVTIVVRMDAENEQPADFFLLPLIDMRVSKLSLGESNGVFWDTYRFDTLAYFVGMAARTRIEVFS